MLGAVIHVHEEYRHIAEISQAIEAAGWEYALFPEGRGAADLDGISAALVAAGATSRVKVGTSIAVSYLRHPYLLACSSNMLQVLSDDRFVLGLGASHPAINEPMGIHMPKPVTEMREYVADVRRYLADRAHVPIWLAATRQPMARLAGQVADAVNIFGVPHSLMAETIQIVKDSAVQAGRTDRILVTCYAIIGLSDDLEQARRAARASLRFYCGFPAYQHLYRRAGYVEEMDAFHGALDRGDEEAAHRALSDRLLDDTHLLGPESRCRDQIERLRASGIEGVLFFPLAVEGSDLASLFRPVLDKFSGG